MPVPAPSTRAGARSVDFGVTTSFNLSGFALFQFVIKHEKVHRSIPSQAQKKKERADDAGLWHLFRFMHGQHKAWEENQQNDNAQSDSFSRLFQKVFMKLSQKMRKRINNRTHSGRPQLANLFVITMSFRFQVNSKSMFRLFLKLPDIPEMIRYNPKQCVRLTSERFSFSFILS